MAETPYPWFNQGAPCGQDPVFCRVRWGMYKSGEEMQKINAFGQAMTGLQCNV
jgi:hypothetical protein